MEVWAVLWDGRVRCVCDNPANAEIQLTLIKMTEQKNDLRATLRRDLGEIQQTVFFGLATHLSMTDEDSISDSERQGTSDPDPDASTEGTKG